MKYFSNDGKLFSLSDWVTVQLSCYKAADNDNIVSVSSWTPHTPIMPTDSCLGEKYFYSSVQSPPELYVSVTAKAGPAHTKGYENLVSNNLRGKKLQIFLKVS